MKTGAVNFSHKSQTVSASFEIMVTSRTLVLYGLGTRWPITHWHQLPVAVVSRLSFMLELCLLNDVFHVLFQLVSVILKPDFDLVRREVDSSGKQFSFWRREVGLIAKCPFKFPCLLSCKQDPSFLVRLFNIRSMATVQISNVRSCTLSCKNNNGSFETLMLCLNDTLVFLSEVSVLRDTS